MEFVNYYQSATAQYSTKDVGRSVKPLPSGWLGALPRCVTIILSARKGIIMRITTILGTRPELIKLSEVIKKLDKHLDHIFVHTGQNYDYELDGIFYEDLNLREPDYNLKSKTVPEILKNVETCLKAELPDAVVILGDTNSALSAYVAKRLKIPVFHLEAGNRCFDDNVPEEINRRIVDHISDINLVYTEHARRNLLAEGLKADRIYLTGSPMREVIDRQKLILTSHNDYYLVSIHREENVENETNLKAIVKAVNYLAKTNKVFISCHPRLAKKRIKWHKNVNVSKPFGFTSYLTMQKDAKCVISDSGTIAEESAILQFPAVTVRDAMERPEAIDYGGLIKANPHNILECVKIAKPLGIPPEYFNPSFSEVVLKIIMGYTGFINKNVWGKYGK